MSTFHRLTLFFIPRTNPKLSASCIFQLNTCKGVLNKPFVMRKDLALQCYKHTLHCTPWFCEFDQSERGQQAASWPIVCRRTLVWRSWSWRQGPQSSGTPPSVSPSPPPRYSWRSTTGPSEQCPRTTHVWLWLTRYLTKYVGYETSLSSYGQQGCPKWRSWYKSNYG